MSWPNLTHYPDILLELLGKTRQISTRMRSLDRGLNHGRSAHVVGATTTQPRLSESYLCSSFSHSDIHIGTTRSQNMNYTPTNLLTNQLRKHSIVWPPDKEVP
jgi:hypothetical protein